MSQEARALWPGGLAIPVLKAGELEDFLGPRDDEAMVMPSSDETEQYELFLRNQLDYEEWRRAPRPEPMKRRTRLCSNGANPRIGSEAQTSRARDGATYIFGSHNDTRDRIAAEFHALPDFTCGFCGTRVTFPTESSLFVETEYTYSVEPRLRADVVALNRDRDVIALVEVILTSTPSDAAVTAHESVPYVAYIEMNQNAIYCSPFCWTRRGLSNLSSWSVPRCEMCERPYHETFSGTTWVDWENPYGDVCLECAAGISNAQWRTPGEVVGGTRAPGPDATVAERFLAFVDSEFWAMVWEGRLEIPEIQTVGRKTRVQRPDDWTR